MASSLDRVSSQPNCIDVSAGSGAQTKRCKPESIALGYWQAFGERGERLKRGALDAVEVAPLNKQNR